LKILQTEKQLFFFMGRKEKEKKKRPKNTSFFPILSPGTNKKRAAQLF
jgi:hypothetical protein